VSRQYPATKSNASATTIRGTIANHENVQASPELSTSEQHPQRPGVPLQEQREHRHPQDVREVPTQRVKARQAVYCDERSDTDEASARRHASALFACAAAPILGLIDSI
jgi:hypothetical protein